MGALMKFASRLKSKLAIVYRCNIRRDFFYREIARWFKDKGDETLRLSYPLNESSVVFDLGGYHGDFAAALHERYGCKIFVFEPVPEFFSKCVERFKNAKNITCLNYGLSSHDEWLDISLAENASSLVSSQTNGRTAKVQVRAINDVIRELGLERIDLIKINIEGGEFYVLPALIESGEVRHIQHIQVQFHNFVPNAADRRNEIRARLAITHDEMWNYEFVWESWKRKIE